MSDTPLSHTGTVLTHHRATCRRATNPSIQSAACRKWRWIELFAAAWKCWEASAKFINGATCWSLEASRKWFPFCCDAGLWCPGLDIAHLHPGCASFHTSLMCYHLATKAYRPSWLKTRKDVTNVLKERLVSWLRLAIMYNPLPVIYPNIQDFLQKPSAGSIHGATQGDFNVKGQNCKSLCWRYPACLRRITPCTIA